jgi:hypothetical protein
MIPPVRAGVLLPFALLMAYGVAFASAALGVVPSLAYDDHPGQLFRAWHVVQRGFAPWAWNAGWWAGYPELQFYPPGFPYAVALLHHASLGAVSVAGAYHLLLWVAYLAPGVTVFALLTRVAGDGWSALPGAFVALTLSAGLASGVEGGVHWGMVSARLGWALLPLMIVVLTRWIEGAGALPSALAPLVALLALTHPTHLPAAAVIALGAGLVPHGHRRGRLLSAALALALAAALTAFWTLPLLARLPHTRALAWGSLATGPAIALARPLPLILIGLALLAWRPAGAAPYPRTVAILARLPWLLAVVVAADALICEPLGIRWLPADRIADGAWMALVLAAGVGAAQVIRRLSAWRRLRPATGALAMVVMVALLALPGHTLTLWPRPGEWPTYAALERGFRLPALWATLDAGPEGRVLFARSGVPLVHGVEWYRPHSHVTALTPLRAGRSIVHGTFTHPSPVAAFFYRGDAGPGAITGLAEQLDGLSLFGRPYRELEPAILAESGDRLGISMVVALDEDLAVRDALAASGAFGPPVLSPPFLVYRRRAPLTIPAETGPGRWQVGLPGSPGQWVSARIAYYPLWRAWQDGQPLATREGRLGELELRLAIAGRPVDLHYGPALPEWAGAMVSGGAGLIWLAWSARAWRRRYRGRRPSSDAARAPPKTNTIAE